LLIVRWDSKRYEFPGDTLWNMLFYMGLAATFGQKIFFVIFFDWQGFIASPWATLTSGSGSMYYGVEVCGMAAFFIYVYVKKIAPLNLMDSIALGLSAAHGIGRNGCFTAGCCYGTPTTSLFGVHFPHVEGYVHPTQLYESALLLTLFAVLMVVRRKNFPPGFMFALYAITYGLGRFFIEFIRADAYHTGFLGISPSQHIGLLSAIAGVLLLRYVLKKRAKPAA
jgi:phosphatidylglycerol:prolipoprotein diacylglycerol transferase